MCVPHPAKKAAEVASRLAVAKNLARIYAEILKQPLPAELQTLLRRLEARTGESSRPPGEPP